MKRKLIAGIEVAALVLFSFVGSVSRTQSFHKRWSKSEIKHLMGSTVVAFVHEGDKSWLGSGVMIDKKGTILTAAHVIAGLDPSIDVVLVSGTTYHCERIAIDQKRDLGVVRILNSAQNFEFANLQSGKEYYVGQEVTVIGHPYGNFWTVTQGIVSRIWRERFTGIWKADTDARVNPGNSGGPVFNERGEVMGIVSAGWVNIFGMSTGIGIFIPITEIHRFLVQQRSSLVKPWPKPRYKIRDVK